MLMDSYPRVHSESVMGFMPRSAALEHLHRFVRRLQSRRFSVLFLGIG
jgi:hypothetical protein